MQRFIGLIRDEHRKGHFPKVWDPSRAQKACLLSPDTSSTVSPATSSALPLPDVHTIDGLQEALKMFGYRIALNGDYGAETRQVVAGFQMRTGIVADEVAGAQTEAKLLSELKRMRETDGHLQR
jgi:peptidoglycan hydrolase-like protein with peptidoglycan-binding domain